MFGLGRPGAGLRFDVEHDPDVYVVIGDGSAMTITVHARANHEVLETHRAVVGRDLQTLDSAHVRFVERDPSAV